MARCGKIDVPAVIGAVIDLGNCLNLTDSKYIELLEGEYDLLRADFKAQHRELPSNRLGHDKLLRTLDCAVISHLHARIDEIARPTSSYAGPKLEAFDSVRGLFSEGDPIYPDAGFKKKTHVQICVRNPNCIKGYFIPRAEDGGWPIP